MAQTHTHTYPAIDELYEWDKVCRKKNSISILIGVCEAELCNKKSTRTFDKHLIRFDVRLEFNGCVCVNVFERMNA